MCEWCSLVAGGRRMDEVVLFKMLIFLILIFSNDSGVCLGDGRGGQTRGEELSPLRCQVCDQI